MLVEAGPDDLDPRSPHSADNRNQRNNQDTDHNGKRRRRLICDALAGALDIDAAVVAVAIVRAREGLKALHVVPEAVGVAHADAGARLLSRRLLGLGEPLGALERSDVHEGLGARVDHPARRELADLLDVVVAGGVLHPVNHLRPERHVGVLLDGAFVVARKVELVAEELDVIVVRSAVGGGGASGIAGRLVVAHASVAGALVESVGLRLAIVDRHARVAVDIIAESVHPPGATEALEAIAGFKWRADRVAAPLVLVVAARHVARAPAAAHVGRGHVAHLRLGPLKEPSADGLGDRVTVEGAPVLAVVDDQSGDDGDVSRSVVAVLGDHLLLQHLILRVDLCVAHAGVEVADPPEDIAVSDVQRIKDPLSALGGVGLALHGTALDERHGVEPPELGLARQLREPVDADGAKVLNGNVLPLVAGIKDAVGVGVAVPAVVEALGIAGGGVGPALEAAPYGEVRLYVDVPLLDHLYGRRCKVDDELLLLAAGAAGAGPAGVAVERGRPELQVHLVVGAGDRVDPADLGRDHLERGEVVHGAEERAVGGGEDKDWDRDLARHLDGSRVAPDGGNAPLRDVVDEDDRCGSGVLGVEGALDVGAVARRGGGEVEGEGDGRPCADGGNAPVVGACRSASLLEVAASVGVHVRLDELQ
mmetsp:Transcript_72798/g.229313  ORF Transcript_72798/g.229313 Transcript_72798/m.229313 type:complete len:650 (+) Transcript_72798:581-2530(+)